MQSWRRPIIGLLIFVTGLLLIGGHHWSQLSRQNRAMTHLHSLDGEVTTHVTYTNWTPTWLPRSRYLSIGTEVITVSLENSRLNDVDLDFLKDLPHLQILDLSSTSLNDRVLLTFPDLDSMQTLILERTEVSVEGLQEVLRMTPNIEDLWLAGTKLQDEDLAVLKTLPKLTSIGLRDTQITDAGIEHLQGLSNLTSVGLSGTQITDAGLKHLLGLPNLRSLFLDDTSITPAGLEVLQELPWLRLLSLEGIEIHDDDVRVFVGMKNLELIILEEGQLTSEVLLRLKSEMPQLHVKLLEPSK